MQLFKIKKVGIFGILGVFFRVILGKSVVFGPKTHSGYCGTVEKRQKVGCFLTFSYAFLRFFHIFLHFLHVFEQFLTHKFKTKQFGKGLQEKLVSHPSCVCPARRAVPVATGEA